MKKEDRERERKKKQNGMTEHVRHSTMNLYFDTDISCLCMWTYVYVYVCACGLALSVFPSDHYFVCDVVCCCIRNEAGDWMQGPYVYALYTQYGFEEGAIGKLFVAGFGSSMIFGTFVGGLADRFGRKLACLLYVLIYSISCVLKAFNNFHVLLLGRVLAGIATSLLASAFESWLVSAHMAHGFNASLLSLIFAPAVFYGNGVTAVAAGQIGHIIVDVAGLGLVAPFFVAIGFLITGGIIVATSWQENYGSAVDIPPANASTKAGESLVSASSSLPPSSQSARNGAVTAYPSVLSRALSTLSAMGGSQLLIFVDAAKLIASREHLLLLGAIQSIFEAAMYTFIFLWTPALSPSPSSPIPHGTIFACFMLACMVGSSFADILMRNEATLRVEDYMSVVFVVSAAALLPPILVHVDDPPNARVTGTFNWWLIFVGFLVYETTVGIFWPSMMKMRSALIPEELRSTLMNMYRYAMRSARTPPSFLSFSRKADDVDYRVVDVDRIVTHLLCEMLFGGRREECRTLQ